MKLILDPGSVESYQRFLAIKRLPVYRINGREAWFPDEYAEAVGLRVGRRKSCQYEPLSSLFDYQRDIARLAIQKRKFSVFAQCGLGKSLILLEFARQAAEALKKNQCVLIVSPLMVVPQTIAEADQKRRAGVSQRLDSVGGVLLDRHSRDRHAERQRRSRRRRHEAYLPATTRRDRSSRAALQQRR